MNSHDLIRDRDFERAVRFVVGQNCYVYGQYIDC